MGPLAVVSMPVFRRRWSPGSVYTISHFSIFRGTQEGCCVEVEFPRPRCTGRNVVGANSFCLLPYARIVGIIWLARTAVKVERSEFILNLDGGRSEPYRFGPGIG